MRSYRPRIRRGQRLATNDAEGSMRGLRRTGRQGVRAAIVSRVGRLQRMCRRWEITLRQALFAVLLPLAGLVQQAFVVRVEQSPNPLASPHAITITVEMTGAVGRVTLSLRWTPPGAVQGMLGGALPLRAS